MELGGILVLLMGLSLAGVLVLGYPVAFALAGVALLFAGIGILSDVLFGVQAGTMDTGYISLFPERIFGTMTNEVLLAVPLFIAMGVILERSNVAEDLLSAVGQVMSRITGGLGLAVTLVGAMLAASTGIVGATVVTMGLLSLPTMLRRGYDPAFAAGSIVAAGTLGQIIPPSIVLVILGDVLSSAWQQAQRDMGIFSPSPMSVGDLFAGALLPGLMLVGLYMLYQMGVALFQPEKTPKQGPADEEDRLAILALLHALLPPLFLILAVLGSILAGVATPTEAAALGAVGALFLGGLRYADKHKAFIRAGLAGLVVLLVAAGMQDSAPAGFYLWLLGGLTVLTALALGLSILLLRRAGVLRAALRSTARISTMVYTILIGAALFALVFRGFGGDLYVENFLTGLPGGVVGAVILVMVVMFLLGFVLDFIEITFVVVPIVAPILLTMGLDPVWLGVMMAVNLQTSFLTPPFGFALFYLRGAAPASLKTGSIYKGVIPFVGIQILALGLLALFPELATWLPNIIFG